MAPFKNPIAAKERKSSKEFIAPTRDEATTGMGFMCAGDEHGVGFRTPVGKERGSGIASGPIPMKSKCYDPKEL